jgi:hypothetical protein
MPIRVTCVCGKSYPCKDEFAGQSVPCPACGQMIQVPALPAAAAPAPKPAAHAIYVTCACGKSYPAKSEFAGQSVPCPACGRSIQIPAKPVAAAPAPQPTARPATRPAAPAPSPKPAARTEPPLEEKPVNMALLYGGIGAVLVVVVAIGIAGYILTRPAKRTTTPDTQKTPAETTGPLAKATPTAGPVVSATSSPAPTKSAPKATATVPPTKTKPRPTPTVKPTATAEPAPTPSATPTEVTQPAPSESSAVAVVTPTAAPVEPQEPEPAPPPAKFPFEVSAATPTAKVATIIWLYLYPPQPLTVTPGTKYTLAVEKDKAIDGAWIVRYTRGPGAAAKEPRLVLVLGPGQGIAVDSANKGLFTAEKGVVRFLNNAPVKCYLCDGSSVPAEGGNIQAPPAAISNIVPITP